MKVRRGKVRRSLALFLAFAMIFTTLLSNVSVVNAQEITGTESSSVLEEQPEPREQPAEEIQTPAAEPEVVQDPAQEEPATEAPQPVETAPPVQADAVEAPAESAPADDAGQVSAYVVSFSENDLTAGVVLVDEQPVDTTYYTRDVEEGSDFIFRVVPNEGWQIASISANGISIGQTGAIENEYIVSNVTADTEIEIGYQVVPAANDEKDETGSTLVSNVADKSAVSDDSPGVRDEIIETGKQVERMLRITTNMAKTRSISSGTITFNVRIYDTSKELIYDVGTDTVSAGDPSLIQSVAYQIPQLSKFVDVGKFGRVQKVVGNWYFPAHDTQPGANVEWSTNGGTKTMTYWVNWYNAGGSGDGADKDDTIDIGSGGRYQWTQYIKYHSNYPDGTDYVYTITYNIRSYTPTYNDWDCIKALNDVGFSVPNGYETKNPVWNTNKDGTGTGYGPGGHFTFKKDNEGTVLDLYAQYTQQGVSPATPVTLTYKDSVGDDIVKSYFKDDTVEVINCTNQKPGYEFKGWDTSSGASTVVYEAGKTFVIKEDTILYAVWEKEAELIDNGNGISIEKKREGEAAAEIGDTIYWTIKVTNNSNVEKSVTLIEQLEDTVLESPKGALLADNQVALAAGESKTVYARHTVTEKDFQNPGHKLYNTVKGSTGSSGDKENPEAKDEGTDITKEIKITWKDGYTDVPIKIEKVNYDVTQEQIQELYPEEPTRDGYEFIGWSNPQTDKDGNITITARWKPENGPDDDGEGISITKRRVVSPGNSANGEKSAYVGDVIYWMIVVKNLSNVEKTVTLTEVLPDTTFVDYKGNLIEESFSLKKGYSKYVYAKHIVTEEDYENAKDGLLFNTVKASTGDPGDKENPEATDEGTEIRKPEDDTYTVIYKDSAEYGGTIFAKHTGLKAGDATPQWSDSWFADKDKDFKMWSPTWKAAVGGTERTIVYTALYKGGKEKYPLTIYYRWNDGKLVQDSVYEAAPDYKDQLYRGESYKVDSPMVDVPFEYEISRKVISGTVGYATTKVEDWVQYTPVVKVKHIYRSNGQVVATVEDSVAKAIPFGGTLNADGVNKITNYNGKVYKYIKADTVTLPQDPKDLTEQPVLNLYYDEEEKVPFTIHYLWNGAGEDYKQVHEDYKASLYSGESYSVPSPTPNVPFNYSINYPTVKGTVDKVNYKVEWNVIYTPEYTIQYICRTNGEVTRTYDLPDSYSGVFGKSYTLENWIGQPIQWPNGEVYTCTKVEPAVFPANPADLTAAPVLRVYYDRMIPTTLTVTKEADKTEVKAGDIVEYTITVQNTGTVVAKNVQVTDILDDNLEFVSSTVTGAEGVYAIGDIQAGENSILTITAKVKDTVTDGTEIANIATVNHTNKPENEPDPSDEAKVTVKEEKVTITIRYIYVDEDGNETELQENVEIPVAQGEEYDVSNQIPETILKEGQSYKKDSVEGDLTGTAEKDMTVTVKYAIETIEATETTLEVTKTADKTEVKAGEEVNYTITVENTGNFEAENVNVTDVLPEGLTFVSAALGGEAIIPDEGVYTVGNIAAGESKNLVITTTVNSNVIANTNITNIVTVTYDNKPEGPDPTDEVDITYIVGKTVTVKYVDDEGNPLKEDVSETVKDGDSYDVAGKIPETFDDEDGNHYMKESVEGDDISGTVNGKNIVVTVIYTKDNIGTDPEDPDKKGDGIPDKYQATVTFTAVNGTINGVTNGFASVIVNLMKDGEYATAEDGGSATLEILPLTGPNEGYTGGTWTPQTPVAGETVITEDITFTITYSPVVPAPVDPEPENPEPENPDPENPEPTNPEPTPNPGTTPVVPVTPAPVNPAPVNPTPAAPVPAAVVPTPVVPVEDEEVPLAAPEVTVDEAEDNLTKVEDGAVPLASGAHEHKCCILHFLILLLALIVELFYTKSMKKHQKKIFEARSEIADYDIQHQSEAA